ncbi:MAG: hypothetical protein U0800_26260 [Isosphaeraceae bacterium]
MLVVVFTCNHCPTAQAYEARFAKFHQEYEIERRLRGDLPQLGAVRLDELGYTDLDDSFRAMKIRARSQDRLSIYDGDDQKVSTAYGVLATPHVFIFDADRKLRYNGRFDDSEVKEVKSRDTINAVEALAKDGDARRGSSAARPSGPTSEDAASRWQKWDAEPVSIDPIDVAGVARLVRNEDEKKLLVVNVYFVQAVSRNSRSWSRQPDVPQPAVPDGHPQPRRAREEGQALRMLTD